MKRLTRFTLLAGLVLALLSTPAHAGHWNCTGCFPNGYMSDGHNYVPWSQPFALSPFESHLDVTFGVTGSYTGGLDSGNVVHRWTWVGDGIPASRSWNSTCTQVVACVGSNITIGYMGAGGYAVVSAWPAWNGANQAYELLYQSGQAGCVAEQSTIWLGGEFHITLSFTSSDPV